MTGTNVIVIPAKAQMAQQVKRQLRVAAYCRVSLPTRASPEPPPGSVRSSCG